MHDRLYRGGRSGWLWLIAALVPLAAGCGPRQPTAPGGERVLGQREEQNVAEVIRTAGLPEMFQFGGRIWQGRRVHRVDASEVAPAESGTVPGQEAMPGANAPAGNTPGGNAPAANQPAGGAEVQGLGPDYVPLPGMLVAGHPIYRRAGAVEALTTDNVFLRAETAPGGAANAPEAGMNAPATAPGTPTGQVTLVEYEAARSLDQVDLSRILTATGLPQRVNWNGRSWTARELALYDTDLYADLRPVPQHVQGHAAYRTDDADQLFLMGEMGAIEETAAPAGANAPGATNAPGTETTPPATNAPGTETTPGTAAPVTPGPVLIRYEPVQRPA